MELTILAPFAGIAMVAVMQYQKEHNGRYILTWLTSLVPMAMFFCALFFNLPVAKQAWMVFIMLAGASAFILGFLYLVFTGIHSVLNSSKWNPIMLHGTDNSNRKSITRKRRENSFAGVTPMRDFTSNMKNGFFTDFWSRH